MVEIQMTVSKMKKRTFPPYLLRQMSDSISISLPPYLPPEIDVNDLVVYHAPLLQSVVAGHLKRRVIEGHDLDTM